MKKSWFSIEITALIVCLCVLIFYSCMYFYNSLYLPFVGFSFILTRYDAINKNTITESLLMFFKPTNFQGVFFFLVKVPKADTNICSSKIFFFRRELYKQLPIIFSHRPQSMIEPDTHTNERTKEKERENRGAPSHR